MTLLKKEEPKISASYHAGECFVCMYQANFTQKISPNLEASNAVKNDRHIHNSPGKIENFRFSNPWKSFFLDQNENLTCFPGTRTSITTIWEEKTKSDFFHRNPPMPTHCAYAQWVRIGGHRGGTAENIWNKKNTLARKINVIYEIKWHNFRFLV